MTKEQFEQEKRYYVALSVAKAMLHQGVIDETEYRAINALLLQKFHPIIEGLYPNFA